MLSSNNSNKREIVSLKTILLSMAASKILSYLNNKDYLQNPFLYYEYLLNNRLSVLFMLYCLSFTGKYIFLMQYSVDFINAVTSAS